MTFTFKLSQRLARMRPQGLVPPAVALAIAAVFACEVPTTPPNDFRTTTASRLLVSPKVLTLPQNQTAELMVVGFTSAGDTADVAVSWTVTSGSITDTNTTNGRHYGRYRPGTDTGTVKVVAKGTPGGVSDTAVVTVTLAPVASVAVSPASAGVTVGQTVQLTATPKDANGYTLTGRIVSWATNNAAVATVNGSGLVTGLVAGAATMTATSEGQSGTATVIVTAVSPPGSAPGTVTDLAVAGVTTGSVTLSFTEVSDGAGQPASYLIRWAPGTLSWASATDVGQGTCTVPLAGTAIGAARSCTVLGLASSTGYQFQLVAFRGTLNVNAVFGALSNVASGTTTASTAPVASVTVNPAASNLTVGQTVQLTATPRDANGNPLNGRVITWASSDALVATVSGSGLVTGVAAGTATITATSEGKGGSAAIAVSGASGRVDTVFAEDFESGNLSAWQDGVDATRHRVVSDPSFAQSGSRYLEVTNPAGSDGGWLTHFFMPGYDSLYVSYYVRFPANWQGGTKLIAFYGSRTDNQWSAFGKAGICPNGTDFFAAMLVTPSISDGLRFYSYYPAMAREPDGITCWGRFGNGSETYVSPLNLSLDRWQHVEFWVKLNTPGQANASQTFWLDGVQRGSWGGFSFRDSTILRLNSVQLTFSVSGGVPQTQKVYVDHLVVLTARPGP